MIVRVAVTADFICPWCCIGHSYLMQALDNLPVDIEADLHFLPFELNPGMPKEGMDRTAYRSAKFGPEKARMLDARVTAAGAQAGVGFNLAIITRTPNTRLAHRLMWAAEGLQARLAGHLFAAYFTEGLDISQPALLRRLAEQAGMAAASIDAVLDGDAGVREVEQLTHDARLRGVQGVPLFEIGKLRLEGAQPAAAIERAIALAADRKGD